MILCPYSDVTHPQTLQVMSPWGALSVSV